MAQDQENTSTTDIIKLIWRNLGPSDKHRMVFIVVFMCFLSLVETAMMGVIALFVSSITDAQTILANNSLVKINAILGSWAINTAPRLLGTLCVMVVLVVAIKNALMIGFEFYSSRFIFNIQAYWGNRFIAGMLNLPYEWMLERNSADLVTNFGRRTDPSGVLQCIMIISSNLLTSSFLLVALLALSPFLGLSIIILMGGIAFAILRSLRPIINRVAGELSDLQAQLNREATKIIHGFKDIRMVDQHHSLSLLSKDLHLYSRKTALQLGLQKASTEFVEFFGVVLMAGLVAFSAFYYSDSPAMITGTLTLMAVSAWRLVPGINRVVGTLSALRTLMPRALSFLGYLLTIEDSLKSQTVSRDDSDHRLEISFVKELELRGISFSYRGAESKALQDVSLRVTPGEMIGIVGPSGAGKSSLIDIIIGYLTPSSGQILLDGLELKPRLYQAWRSQLGYVPQMPYIADDTLLANIAFGQPPNEVDIAWVEHCCRMANIDQFMHQLPNGLYTRIGERGVLLSGGQRQRVSIARALYRKPKLIIFDEATSALDSIAEHSINQTIHSLHGTVTMLIVAHRRTSVADCDRLVWIDKGKVVMDDSPSVVLSHYSG